MVEKIRIFIGKEPNQWLPSEVLRWSILRHTHSPVEIQDLIQIPLKLNLPASSGFAFHRFYVPEACGYKGRAIYLDSDTLVLKDIQELMHLDMQGKGALARRLHDSSKPGRYTSVMLLDCERLKNWNIKFWASLIAVQPDLYHSTMWGMPGGLNVDDFGDLPPEWNDLDHADTNTRIIHYTSVQMHPWNKPGHPYGSLFFQELQSAIEHNEIPVDLIKREISRGSVSTSILDEMPLQSR